MEEAYRPTAQSKKPKMDSERGILVSAPYPDNDGEVQQPYYDGDQTFRAQQQYGPSTGTPMDMSHVAAALPDYVYRQMPQTMYQQPYPSHVQHSPMMYPYQGARYHGTVHNGYHVPYNMPMHPQGFPPQRSPVLYSKNPTIGMGPQIFHGQAYFSHQSPMSPSTQELFSSTPQIQSYGHSKPPMYGARSLHQYYGPQIRVDNFTHSTDGNQTFDATHASGSPHSIRRTSSATSLKISSALRGPPRKPKQSGHALWVGNLPPGTNILELKDHFSRDATDDIESVFLISKSNCAFVNYKSEQSCAAAMTRFHDSRFNGVRLVCRLRRGGGPTSVATLSGMPSSIGVEARAETSSVQSPVVPKEEKDDQADEDIPLQTKVREKYFIIKSLTIEDLERSVHNGIWATQSHNEDALNKAFQTAENVYLIFSANKSGEYFGYARMDSAINDESAASIDVSSTEAKVLQVPHSPATSEVPLTIPTTATATAPKGYIIDDSARGTIFWEAESSQLQIESSTSGTSTDNVDSGDDAVESQPKSPLQQGLSGSTEAFGKPFRITWISTEKLPFYRTRGLRNPWNTNREVKIARDGTELEPGIGRKLVNMFNTNFEAGKYHQQGQYPGAMMSMPGQGPAYRPF